MALGNVSCVGLWKTKQLYNYDCAMPHSQTVELYLVNNPISVFTHRVNHYSLFIVCM